MKKYILTLLLAITALAASAEFRWGPTAGVNVTNYYWRQPLLKSDYRAGFNAGLQGELMIPGIGFGIDMGLLYAWQGASVNLGNQYVWSSDGYTDTDFRIHTIQVPVHLRFKWTRLNGAEHYAAPLAFVGPVFNFAAGQSKCDAIETPAGSVGLQFGIGGEFLEHIQLTCCYQWGVTYQLRTVKLDNLSARASAWVINVSYLF